MDYQKIYDKLVDSRKLRVFEDGVYYESHHIVMKSMGGTDDPDNIVRLTPREHFLAHWLLWRIHRNRQTASAFWFMNLLSPQSSRAYEEARLSQAKFMSQKMTLINKQRWETIAPERRAEKMQKVRDKRSPCWYRVGKWSTLTHDELSERSRRGHLSREKSIELKCICEKKFKGNSYRSVNVSLKKHQQFCQPFLQTLTQIFGCQCGAKFSSVQSRAVHRGHCIIFKQTH